MKERTEFTDLSSACHMNSAVPFHSVSVVFYHRKGNLGGAGASLRTMAWLHVVILVTSRVGTCRASLHLLRVLQSPEPQVTADRLQVPLCQITFQNPERGLAVCSESCMLYKMIQSKIILETLG